MKSIKVLAAKGLVEVRPKLGIRLRPREEWNLMDPDLLDWQGEAGVDDLFVRNLCEVRLVVETAACELAALRGSEKDFAQIKNAYRQAESVAQAFDRYGSRIRASCCRNVEPRKFFQNLELRHGFVRAAD